MEARRILSHVDGSMATVVVEGGAPRLESRGPRLCRVPGAGDGGVGPAEKRSPTGGVGWRCGPTGSGAIPEILEPDSDDALELGNTLT